MVAVKNSLSWTTSSSYRVPDRPRAWGYRFLSWAGKDDVSLRPGPAAPRTQGYGGQGSLGVTQKYYPLESQPYAALLPAIPA